MITGVFSKYADTTFIAKEVIGIRDGLNHIGAMHIVNTKKGVLFLRIRFSTATPTPKR
jgi:malate dehydrogenase (oxaloacetate-decarboxylating)(NADP+)